MGELADVIASTMDLLMDIAALSEVDFVMKAGHVHKRDGHPTPFL